MNADRQNVAATPVWHALQRGEVLGHFANDGSGLRTEEAATRILQFGPNRLPAPPRPGALWRFLLQFHNILIYALIVSSAVTALLGHWVDTLVILAVVLVNAVIGFVQEGRAERAMESIRELLSPKATVLRDGQRRSLPAEAVVPGDLVLLEAGDRVPADLRLIEVHGLGIQEALLTGEAGITEKHTLPVAVDAPLSERACMAFSGTSVASGAGLGVVVGTGSATAAGRISGLVSGVETLTTPLVAQLDAFARWLTVLIFLVAVLLLIFGHYVQHIPFGELFMAVVSLSVSALPAGLPAVLTITLAVGVRKMAERHAVVRQLPAIETIGAVSVICTDKTGTLTRNEMAAVSVITAAGCCELQGHGYAPTGVVRCNGQAQEPADREELLLDLARVAWRCNDAALRHAGGVWRVEGDPMEGALLAMAGRLGVPLAAGDDARRVASIPFDARHRYMATLHLLADGTGMISVKGAPEEIIGMCVRERLSSGAERPIDVDVWRGHADRLAARGERVLAFAACRASVEEPLSAASLEGQLVLLGLVGLADPPRPEVIEAVAECQRAGIRVKMITGDHAGTAAAIGAQVGLEGAAQVLTGSDIDTMDDASLRAAVLETDVYARTSPERKLRLVKALQAQGLTVAMTGDGVNDAPALRRADVGIAMGQSGSEATKEASDIVLADDNFASIVAAVREGRTVYDNIRKVITWTLPTNAGEALTLIVPLLLGLPLLVTPIQILWVNLITSATLGLVLAFEPTEARTMQRPPRRRDEPIVDGSLLWQIVLVSVLMVVGVFALDAWARDRGYSTEVSRTLATNAVVVMEVAYLFFARNWHGTSLTWQAVQGTSAIWLTLVIVVIAQLSFTYLPLMQALFDTRAVSIVDGLVVIGVGVALFALVETEKQLRLSLGRLQPEAVPER